jgi:hypothetical protein
LSICKKDKPKVICGFEYREDEWGKMLLGSLLSPPG